MSTGGVGAADARRAAELNSSLMKQYQTTGLPIFQQGLSAVHGELSRPGLPGYVNDAYAGAQTSAYEAATSQTAQARAQLLNRNPNTRLGTIAQIYAGGARANQSEQAGIALSKANTTISRRNQLVDLLRGGGFQATDLSVGFGGLTNRALATASQGGNQLYEGIVSGVGFGAPLLMSALTPNSSSALAPIPQGRSYSDLVNAAYR